MKLTINYQNGILNIPAVAAENAKNATRSDLAVLVCIAAEPRVNIDFDGCVDEIAARAGVGRDELFASVSFWRGAGVLTVNGAMAREAEAKEAPRTSPLQKEDLPILTAADVSNIMNTMPERRSLIDACQQTMGKMFNTTECSVILGLKEYLCVEDEYILTLAAYCVKKDKRSVKYLEKTALSLYDREIDTTASLEEHIRWLETKDVFETKLRRLLGVGVRAFSKKEKECVERWLREYSYEYDVIELAYGKTVDAIGKASVPYMDKILASWYAKGYKTAGDVETGEVGAKPSDAGSFDTDDFFRMAVKRGLES